MQVSIITVTWNSEKTIKETLDSISNQDYPNIEHIIVDGASTDKTLEIIESSEFKNIKIISEKDTGIYDALNKGIELANGEIIGLLHSDDVYANNHTIKTILEEFSNKSVDAVYGDIVYVKEDVLIRYWRSKDFQQNLLWRGWMPPHTSLFLRKEVYQKVGNFNINYKIAADYDFIIRAFKEIGSRSVYIPKVLVKMKIGGESNKSIKNTFIKSMEDYLILRKNNVGGIISLILKNISKLNQFFYSK